jgi:hypothetical protein
MSNINIDTMCEIMKPYIKYPMSDDELKEHISEGEYSAVLIVMRKYDRLSVFKKIFEHLPQEHIYPLFLEVYRGSEYGFNRITKKIIDKIIQVKPKDIPGSLKKFTDPQNYITIYRGEYTKSTPVEKALSWSLNYDIAVSFAKRFPFGGNGYVYTARVSIDNVIAYIHEEAEEIDGVLYGGGEEEILVRYKDLEIINKEVIAIG